MRILFCNVAFAGRSGTETYLGDLAPAMRERGHEVACLTTKDHPIDSGVGRELTKRGIVVAQEPADIPWVPEIIHGHHRDPTRLAIEAWPRSPALFFVHDARAPADEPLVAPSIVHHLAIDHLCARRLTGLPPERCHVVYNAVDTTRFVVTRRRPRRRPRRALLFMGHAPDYGFVRVVKRACRDRRLSLERMMLAGREQQEPEKHLGRFDLCFARGRSAMEAMASGLGVICCGSEGLGPLVTPENFEEARRYNFGRGLLSEPHTIEGVHARLDGWRRDEVAAVTERLRSECSLPGLVETLEALYEQALGEGLELESIPRR